MENTREVRVVQSVVKCPADENGNIRHITEYGTFQDHLDRIRAEYEQAKAAFFATDIEDETIIKRGKAWEETGKVLVGYSQTLFNLNKEDQEMREESVLIMDMFSKDMGVMNNNIAEHREALRKKFEDDEKKQEQMRKEVLKSNWIFLRALNTFLHYRDLYMKGECHESAQLRIEREAAAEAEEMRELIPEGRMYMPAWIYPPVDFPEGTRLPDPPEAWNRLISLPAKDKVYNTEIDEFVVRPGYVSEDGLMTDRSVIFNTEEKTVTMQLTGCPPVVWPYWKPKDTRDMFEAESRVAKYLRGYYLQLQQDRELEALKPRWYEEEIPVYDRPA